MSRPTRRNRRAEGDFRGEKRSNATHASTTDPDAWLCRFILTMAADTLERLPRLPPA